MLQNWPIEPFGQVGSAAMCIVHVCEHTGIGNWLKLLVQALPMHSLEVSVTVVQVAPNDPGAGPDASAGDASGVGDDELLEQAARASDNTSKRRCIWQRYNGSSHDRLAQL